LLDVASVKIEHPLKSCIENRTYELRDGTATSRTPATTGTMEKR
jgi:hypothetical protein